MKIKYRIAFIILLCIEILITFTSGFLRHTVGDFFAVMLLYALIKSFVNISPFKATTITFVIAVIIELLQITNLSDHLIFQKLPFLKIILGATFEWNDLAVYALGILFILFLERKWNDA